MLSDFEITIEAQSLLHDCQRIVDRHEWMAAQQGSRFNIFEVLDRTTDEVKCHSAVLGELLSSNGSHGQGAIFQKLFFDVIREIDFANEQVAELIDVDGDWELFIERSFILPAQLDEVPVSGRIDLLLKQDNALLIVENKIYAEDQHRQLLRYHQFAGNTPHILFYLTLAGDEPSVSSLGGLNPEDVVCLSYRYHICEWISRCIERTCLIPNLRETLHQYLRLVRELSAGVQNQEMTMEISRLIATPQQLHLACELEKATREAKVGVHLAFWQNLQERLHEKFGGGGDYLKARIFSKEQIETYHAKGNVSRSRGLSYDLGRLSENRHLVLLLEDYWEFYWGIAVAVDGTQVRLDTEPAMAGLFSLLVGEDASYSQDPYIIWKAPKPRLLWEQFDENCCALADETARQRVVDSVFHDILRLTEIALPYCNANEPK